MVSLRSSLLRAFCSMPGLVATFASSSILYDTLSLPDSSEAAVARFLQNADMLLTAVAWKTLEFTCWARVQDLFPELSRWGCREHFVSGCWHSSGRDRGRYPRECWLSTLGVLHPGVPVMWYGHIRDLFPTAEGCKGSRLPNVTMLHWAQQK